MFRIELSEVEAAEIAQALQSAVDEAQEILKNMYEERGYYEPRDIESQQSWGSQLVRTRDLFQRKLRDLS